MPPSLRRSTWLLLLAVFFAGIAQIAVLPPFEGYDEIAHFSSIQQIADTGRIPLYGRDRLSADIAAYPGPMAAAEGQPYRDAARVDISAAGPTHFAPGRSYNWEAQHPPLYYLLMSLPYRAFASFSWRWHMFALRSASWAVAFAGFAWGAVLAQRLLLRHGVTDARLLLPALWPFLFPEFFPEFARLTNDSLCILLVACAWWLALGWLQRGDSWVRAVALGVTLGAGLLTKAFFLPITVGVGALLAVAAARGSRRWPVAALAPVLAILIGGAWYLAKLRMTGSFTGSADLIELQAHGGLLHGLRAHFSAWQYLRGIGGIVAGFCWAGTWSFVQPSRLYWVPMMALAVLPPALYVWRARRWTLAALTPVFFVAPVLAGLLYHQLAMVAETGAGNGTPGWYLHMFAGPLACVLVLGWAGRGVMLPLLAYAGAFFVAVNAMQLAFFSGCLPRTGLGKVSLVESVRCLGALAPLHRVALPDIAAPVAAVAVVALLAACVLAAPRQAGSG